MKVSILMSSPGTVLSDIMQFPEIKSQVNYILTDRICGSIDIAVKEGIPYIRFEESNNEKLSDMILDHLIMSGTDYLIVMFSRLLKGKLLESYRGRLFNFHPGLLPAFIGIGARNKAFKSTVRFIGNTCHVIDESIDGGPIVQQSIFPRGNRHRIILEHDLYVQHCKMVIQLIQWLTEGRCVLSGTNVNVVGARFCESLFSPNLDSPIAINFKKDLPENLRQKLLEVEK